jgi:hypothetical protein
MYDSLSNLDNKLRKPSKNLKFRQLNYIEINYYISLI